jgi:hypothetical protein
MKIFNKVFNVGLAIAILILLSKDLSAISGLLYVGAVHMVILAIVARKSNPNLMPGLVEGLHKAGFLHTLMALAGALIVTAHLLGPGYKGGDLGQVLLPMGAALIPHVLGVWFGQILGSGHFEGLPALEESVFKKLCEDADAARDVIRGLFQEREQALREQIASLQIQRKLLEDIQQRSSAVLEQGVSEFRKLSEAARRISLEIGTSLQSLDTLLKTVTASGASARSNVDGCGREVKECSTALQDALKVIRDTHKLHDAISDLLTQKLFRSGVEV